MARRVTQKPTSKRGGEVKLASIEQILKSVSAQMTTLVIERADAAARFEERVKEDKAERRELFEKVDSIDTRLVKVEGKCERIEVIESAVWKHEKARNQAEGVKIFVGKVATVSKAIWLVIGGAVMAGLTWLWQHWPLK